VIRGIGHNFFILFWVKILTIYSFLLTSSR